MELVPCLRNKIAVMVMMGGLDRNYYCTNSANRNEPTNECKIGALTMAPFGFLAKREGSGARWKGVFLFSLRIRTRARWGKMVEIRLIEN